MRKSLAFGELFYGFDQAHIDLVRVRYRVVWASLRGMNAVSKINRQAFVEQDLHAILARRESFASSSDRTAISRVTVGNCRKNSPSE